MIIIFSTDFRYIDRFRNSAPKSREERSKERRKQDFWWLDKSSGNKNNNNDEILPERETVGPRDFLQLSQQGHSQMTNSHKVSF